MQEPECPKTGPYALELEVGTYLVVCLWPFREAAILRRLTQGNRYGAGRTGARRGAEGVVVRLQA